MTIYNAHKKRQFRKNSALSGQNIGSTAQIFFALFSTLHTHYMTSMKHQEVIRWFFGAKNRFHTYVYYYHR